MGWLYFGPAELKCLCTTEVKKDVTGAQESWSCEYRCEGTCQTWRLNPWTEELLQEECEEKKRILGSNDKRLEDKSPPQGLLRKELRIHWKTSQERILLRQAGKL